MLRSRFTTVALLSLLAVSAFTTAIQAQAGKVDPPGGKLAEGQITETLIKLAVEPMLPPKPALKYQLLPEFREIQPGNPIHGYLKCFAEQNNYFYGKESVENQQKWLEAPLNELPEAVRGYTERGPMKRLDEAARLDNPNWGILLELRREGINTLLPDLQILRNLAGWNKIRMRFEVKEKRFNDVIRSAKSGFQLARHMDENMTLIGDLVGFAIAYQTVGPMEEMLNQPGAPNLFWAWSHLPTPLVPIEKGMAAERLFVLADFGDLLDPKRIWGEDEIITAKERFILLAGASELSAANRKTVEEWMIARLKDELWQTAARMRLIEEGFPAEKVKKYPVEQLLTHEMVRMYEIGRDEAMKYIQFPLWQVRDQLIANDRKLGENPTVEQIFSHLLTPALYKIKTSQARLEQRLAMLRIVEALRWYAAENDGKFPPALADFKEPLPADPVTGKPFKYEFDGKTAHLRGTPPKGMEKNANYNIHYEITLRK